MSHSMMKSLLHLYCEKRHRLLGIFYLKDRLRGDIINVYKYPVRENEEERRTLFSVVSTDRIRGNGYNFKKDKREMQMWSLLSGMRVHSIKDEEKKRILQLYLS